MPISSPPVISQEAGRVWKSQARPSARSVARALTHAGRPVHFTTVARWKRHGLLTIFSSSTNGNCDAIRRRTCGLSTFGIQGALCIPVLVFLAPSCAEYRYVDLILGISKHVSGKILKGIGNFQQQ